MQGKVNFATPHSTPPRNGLFRAVAALCATMGLAFWCAPGSVRAESVVTSERTVSVIASGVHVIRHADAADGNPSGNTTVIEGDRGLLVVDSCYLPSQARQDIEDIRNWSHKPVRYLVNTHWHPDHVRGNAVYAQAYPGITIVAHREMQRLMRMYETGNRERAPRRLHEREESLRSGRANGKRLTSKELADLASMVTARRAILAELQDAPLLLPDLLVSDGIDIDLGNRVVQVRHSGPGDTLGDVWLYLPNDKVLVTGDLLVAPVPYFFAGYPRDHRNVLLHLAELDSTVIVPGHGPIFHDKTYLNSVVDLLSYVITGVDHTLEAHGSLGTTLEDVKRGVDLTMQRHIFAGDDSTNQSFFDDSVSGLLRDAFNQAPR